MTTLQEDLDARIIAAWQLHEHVEPDISTERLMAMVENDTDAPPDRQIEALARADLVQLTKMMSHDPPVLQLLAAEQQLNPTRLRRVKETARMLRPGYPEIEAFSKGELFSPQKLMRQAKQALAQMTMPQTRHAVEELIAFADMLDGKLCSEQGYKSETSA